MESKANVMDEGVAPATTGPLSATPIGKSELCAALGWARTRLDRRIETDGNFPVLQRGNRGGGWAFDLADVVAYLDGRGSELASVNAEIRSPGSASSEPRSSRRPRRGNAEHQGDRTARQERDWLQAQILSDKLKRDRGELVPAEEMRHVLTTMLVHLAQGLDRLPDQIVERLSLPEGSSDQIRDLTDDLRRLMVDDLRRLMVNETLSLPD
jgi:phage terminase Nu1 subunit (DNA packaging protein)